MGGGVREKREKGESVREKVWRIVREKEKVREIFPAKKCQRGCYYKKSRVLQRDFSVADGN